MNLRLTHALTLGLAALALPLAAPATEVYKWVDARGITQYGNIAPNDKLDTAQRFYVRDNYSSVYTQGASFMREYPLPAPTPTNTSGALPNFNYATPKPPSREERLTAYRASQECFEQFRNVNATMKAEAFSVCREMKDPQGEQVRP